MSSIEDVEEESPDELNRITVVETVYHQVSNEDPTVVESKYDRLLETSEQAYTRRLKVSKEWQPLDVGWLADVGVGLLVIQNREGFFAAAQVNPTQEEQEDVAKRTIEIGSGSQSVSWIVPPGESMRGYPAKAPLLKIRCQHGTATVVINAFPK